MSAVDQSRRMSWYSVKRELAPRQAEVIHALEQHGPRSAWELSRILKQQVYVVRPRLTELERMGLIREVGTRYENHYAETVWRIAEQSGEQKELDLGRAA